MSFELLSPKLRELLKKRGFEEPTLPQKMVIKPILEGRNVLLISGTGSGKTESAMLPLLDKITHGSHNPISILYITPLKSLNRDLWDRLSWWCRQLDIDISVRHGDTNAYVRRMQAESPSDILVITPETLQAILPGSRMKEHLKNVRFIVVDEVHEIADSKRGTQLSIGLERLRELCGEPQVIGLSATVGSPETIAKFLTGNRQCDVVKAISVKELDITVESPKPQPGDARLASELYVGADTAGRVRRIYELIGQRKSVIAFTNTREFAEILSSRLKKVGSEKIETHHGSLAKEIRIEAEQRFKKEEIKGIVATSSLELGIDIGAVDLVIQYMSPRQVSKFVQRAGRAGHRLDVRSDCVIIASDADDCFESAAIAKGALGGKIEPGRMHMLAADVLAHQVVGLSLDNYDVTIDRAYGIVKRAYPYSELTMNDFLAVCRQMEALGYIRVDGTINRRRKGWQYYFENLSTIPSMKQYRVLDMLSNRFVAVLDEEFVALHGEPGTTFVCKGQAWRIVAVEDGKITVEPVEDMEAAIPAWEGELIPVPMGVAQEVGSMRGLIAQWSGQGDAQERIMAHYPVNADVAAKLSAAVASQSKFLVPTDKDIVFEHSGSVVVIHSCFGSLVNDTLGRALSALLTARVGAVKLKTDPYRIMLYLPKPDRSIVDETFDALRPDQLEAVVEANVSKTEMFAWRFLHVAKRFGVISRDAEFQKMGLKRIIALYEGTPVYREAMREIFIEKLDVKNAAKILGMIRSGAVAVRQMQHASGLSPMAMHGMKGEFAEIIGPQRPEQEIMKIFRERILDTRVRLVCANCGWTLTTRVKNAPDEPQCSSCKARLIAMLRPYDEESERAIKKHAGQKELTDNEKRLVDQAMKTADLIIVSGKKAMIVLAGRGIGPQTASRIMSRYHTAEDDLFREMLAAERTYLKNKRFWS